MNVLLWTLQILLAFWNITGGMYTASNYKLIRSNWAKSLPKAAWIAISALQIFFGLCLILPGAFGVLPNLTVIAAIYLAINSLSGCVLACKYKGFPGVLWGVVPAVLAAFVAYGRW